MVRLSRFLKVCKQHAEHMKEGELIFGVYTPRAFIGKSASIHAVKEMTRNLDSFQLTVVKTKVDGNHTTNYIINSFDMERDGEGYRVTDWHPTVNGYADDVKNHLQMSALSQENERGIATLLRICKEMDDDIVFKVYDTESYVGRARGIDSVLDLLEGGDEQVSVHCCILADSGELVEDLGWFGIMPYEWDGDWLYNRADNDFCEEVEERLKKALDKQENMC